MRFAVHCFILIVFSLLAPRSTQAVEPLTIPAAGLFDLEEFTIEMWVMLAFDPQEPHEGQMHRGFIFELHYGDAVNPEDGVHAYLFTEMFPREKVMGKRTYNQVYANGGRLMYSLLADFPQDAVKNSWHHFAVSFRGRKRGIYINGEGGESELNGRFAHVLRHTAVLRLGTDRRKGGCELGFDEIRVSSIARARDQLGFFAKEPLKPDPYTTLLIGFDGAEVDQEGRTIKPRIAATSTAATLLPTPLGARWIDGKFGKALLLAPERAQ